MVRLAPKSDATGFYLVRPRYRSEDYTVPPRALALIERWRGDYLNTDALLTERGGPFGAYVEIERVEHDGKKWVILKEQDDFCIEVEVTKLGLGEIRPIEPERAWKIAREYDKTRRGYRVVVEGENEDV